MSAALSTTYDAQRERARAWAARSSATGRDIGPLPEVANPARRGRCRRNFRLFCQTYHASAFKLAWSDDHKKLIAKVEECVLRGGLHAFAMPRGSGKTTLLVKAAEWATLYGHRRWVCLIGSAEDHSRSLVSAIKTDFTWNALLRDDFPESVLPFSRLEGEARRCSGQTIDGVPTSIRWEAGRLVFPMVVGSKSSGSVISSAGLTGNLRGQQHTTPEGEVLRPDFVIPDDPQTAESARSPSQVRTRQSLINSDAINLGGPGVKIAGVMAGTVMCDDDLMHRMLDRKQCPDWQGERMQLVYQWPDREDLWDQYGVLRAADLDGGGDGSKATKFYRKNRRAMDRGAKVAWKARKNSDEITAIQHAWNLRLRDEQAFWSEYQNQPLQDNTVEAAATPVVVRDRQNGYARGVVPPDVNHLTAFVDVQDRVLWWVLCGWADDFTGYVIDYGVFPDQKRRYVTLNEVRHSLSAQYGGAGLEGGWLQGVRDLSESLFRARKRNDGVELPLATCLVDSAYGSSQATIFSACDQFDHGGRMLPSRGVFIGATTNPFNDRKPQRGERMGFNWRLSKVPDNPKRRRVLYDTNFWKGFVHERVAFAAGDRGGMTLFKGESGEHDMFADQFCAETAVKVQAKGREVIEWKSSPSKPDNHFLDCVAGAAVAASIVGVSADGHASGAKRKAKKKINLSQAQKKRSR